MDSFLEACTNTGIGFFISWAVWVFIVDPLFGFHASAGRSLLITSIFTVTSIARSYVLRRLFDGRTAYAFLKGMLA
jgi:hypothetical protein